MSFASPLFWQIRYLVQGLNKKNQKTHVAELDSLVRLFGPNARIHLLACILEDLDVRSAATRPAYLKDSVKAQVFLTQVTQLADSASLGADMRNVIEKVIATYSVSGGSSPVNEEYVSHLCAVLKIPLSQELDVALACAESTASAELARSGKTFLLSKLKLSSDLSGSVPTATVHRIILYLRRIEDLSEEEFADCEAALLNCDRDMELRSFVLPARLSTVRPTTDALCPLRSSPSSSKNRISVLSAGDILKCVSLADVMEDLGYVCTESPDAVINLAASLGYAREGGQLPESEVARVLVMMTKTKNSDGSAPTPLDGAMSHALLANMASLADGAAHPSVPDENPTVSPSWNVSNFVDAVRFLRPELNWDGVVLALEDVCTDHVAGHRFTVIAEAVARATGKPLQFNLLLGRAWKTPRTQLHLIGNAILISDERIVAFGTSGASPWANVSLVQTLLLLAECGLYAEVRHLFVELPVKQCPDVLLVALMMAKSERDTLREEMYATLLPSLLNKSAANGLDANSLRIFQRVWDLKRELLLRGLVDKYTRDPNSLQFILEIICQVPEGFQSVLVLPMPRMVLDMACLASVASENPSATASHLKFNLEKWIVERLSNANSQGGPKLLESQYHELLMFVQLKLNRKDVRVGVALSPVSVARIFKALSMVESALKLSEETVVKTKKMFALCCKVYPQLAQPHFIEQVAASTAESSASEQPAMPGAQENTTGSEDIEEQANAYFQKIYTSQQSIGDVIEMLKRFKNSSVKREQDIFSCMVHNLFDEYRYFHKYPEEPLKITGKLFGAIIEHHLVSNMTLGIALRYVLEALRQEPSAGAGNNKMFSFGMYALEQFKSRLAEWPQYCNHILHIAHLQKIYPEVVAEIARLVGPAQQSLQQQQQSQQPPAMRPMLQPGAGSSEGTNILGASDPGHTPVPNGIGNVAQQQPQLLRRPPQAQDIPAMARIAQKPIAGSQGPSLQQEARTQSDPDANYLPLRGTESGESYEMLCKKLRQVIGGPSDVDGTEELEGPGDEIEDQIHFVINNMTKQNMERQVTLAKQVLRKEHHKWVSNYIVVKRVSTQANFHEVYMEFLDRMREPDLFKEVRHCTLSNVRKLLRSNKIVSSTTERSLLKNLGSWLGRLTLGKDIPLLHREVDLKELLYDGYERGWLIAVVPFAAKILASTTTSRVFKPPNPWLVGLLRTLSELYQLPDLKLNITFEIEVLCKKLGVDLKDISPSNRLAQRLKPKLEGNPDFNVMNHQQVHMMGLQMGSGSSSMQGLASQRGVQSLIPDAAQQKAHPSMQSLGRDLQSLNLSKLSQNTAVDEKVPAEASKLAIPNETVIPNLASYIRVSDKLGVFQSRPDLKRAIPIAVDRAIREIIQPVVERSVTIACITTRELVTKDFAMEPDEKKMSKAAHLMVANLAGSLSLVTCKEPLRVIIGNHLRTLLGPANLENAELDQICRVCADENLDLGCMLIEKAATEKARRDVDEQLETALRARKEHRERTGQPFYDMAIFTSGSRYPSALPDELRPRPGANGTGISPQQLLVYEAFQRIPRQPVAPPSGESAIDASHPKQESEKTVGSSAMGAESGEGDAPFLLGQWRMVISFLDQCMLAIGGGENFVEPSLSSLPNDHEIKARLMEMSKIASVAKSPAVREEAATAFAQPVLKRLYETKPKQHLRRDVHVEILRCMIACSPSGVLRKKLTQWVMYAPPQHKLNREVSRALLSSSLLNLPEYDPYLAKLMDGGRQAAVVAFACYLVQSCVLIDRTVSAGDFRITLGILEGLSKADADIARLLTDVRSSLSGSEASDPKPLASGSGDGPPMRQRVGNLLQAWVQLVQENDAPTREQSVQYLQLLSQQGVLKGDENADRFFRIMLELCVEAYMRTPPSETKEAGAPSKPGSAFTAIDAYAKLVVLLVKSADARFKNSLLAKVLDIAARVLHYEIEMRSQRGAALESAFDQRPYFRFFLSLQVDITSSYEAENAGDETTISMLKTFADLYHRVLTPLRIPSFTYAWLELVTHPTFMPRFLRTSNEKYWGLVKDLLVDVLDFMRPSLKASVLTDALRGLYKGFLRVMLVLLHDFPEFLCAYHVSFCDAIAPSCVQLRNLILSAFPRSMRLPDPFTPDLKVDLLPEISLPPRVLSDFSASLVRSGLKNDLDVFLRMGNSSMLASMGLAERLEKDTSLMNSVVMHVGMHAIAQLQQQNKMSSVPNEVQSAPMELYMHLATTLSNSGRYTFLNAIANQLRYPNNHTHYFSCVVLFLFSEARHEILQEQITRVLLERLMAHRPHPWGLLITFIELIKNPRYNFWKHKFVVCAPEIERLFESVGRMISGK